MNEHELLAKYARTESEPAFAALVARHVNLVYSAALRFTGNPHHAGEITQAVFIILARKAGGRRRGTVLSGWLYQTARLTASNFVKSKFLPAAPRTGDLHAIHPEKKDPAAWEHIAPLLDEAMGRLGETDRNAVVLRFFENKTAREVAAALKLKEAAAHKRVSRALEKLRKFFTKRGVILTTTAIAGTVTANSVQAAPVALLGSITAVAVAKGVTASGSTLTLIKGALKLMAWKKVKVAIVAGAGVLLAAGAIILVVEKKIHATRLIEEHRAHEGTTRMNLTGNAGTVVTGFYTQNDQHIVVSNSLPWSFVGTNVSQFEFHTSRPEDSVAPAPAYDGNGAHARATETLESAFPWMQGRVENGFIVLKHTK